MIQQEVMMSGVWWIPDGRLCEEICNSTTTAKQETENKKRFFSKKFNPIKTMNWTELTKYNNTHSCPSCGYSSAAVRLVLADGPKPMSSGARLRDRLCIRVLGDE